MPVVALAPSSRIQIEQTDLCHPVVGRQPFTEEGWLFELKHDGFRAMVRKDGPETDLLTRWGRSLAESFPEVTEALRELPDGVYDGELVVPGVDRRWAIGLRAKDVVCSCRHDLGTASRSKGQQVQIGCTGVTR